MHCSFLNISQRFIGRILTLCLISLLCFSGISAFVAPPVYATTSEEQKLYPPKSKTTLEDRVDRAYDQSEATGMLEEMKQQSANPSEYFDPNKKANMKTIPETKKDADTGLVEKAKELVDKVTGKE